MRWLINWLIDWLDSLQRRHRVLAFAWAVQKKFSDDRGGYLAALVTYYGFLSVFPLLLAAFTLAAFVLAGHHALLVSIEAHVSSYPIVGSAAKGLAGHTLKGSPLALAVGLLGLVWGAQGLANAAQFTMAEAWNVPGRSRPGLLPRLGRGLAWYVLFGLGVLVSTFVASLGSLLHWSGGPLLSTLAALVVDIGLFVASFKLLGPKEVTWRQVLPGGAAAGAVWSVLTGVGVGLSHHLAHASPLYGSFSTVLGLLAFLYLGARVSMYAIEANVVRAQRLWPRALGSSNLEPADRLQLERLARREERVADQRVRVDF